MKWKDGFVVATKSGGGCKLYLKTLQSGNRVFIGPDRVMEADWFRFEHEAKEVASQVGVDAFLEANTRLSS